MEHIVSKKVSPIPRGYRTATTCLTVVDIDSAVAFYQAAFAAELLTRLMDPSESYAIHATIKIGNSIIALNPESAEMGVYAPVTLGAAAGQVHLYVDSVEASWERAIEAGAMVYTPIYDAYWGDRIGVLRDGNGHLWSVASKIENVSQDEIVRRSRAAVAPVEYEVPEELLYAEEVVAADTVAA